MSIILIPATKSLTVTDQIPNGNINNDTITVGSDGNYNYISYLFFDISAIPVNISILNAELVLFKQNNFFNDCRKEFYIYPLSDYFSTYTNYNNRPNVNAIIRKIFYPFTSKVAVTANLTSVASLWVKNQLTNTGIALVGKKNNGFVDFGSAICTDPYLIPFIKVAVAPIITKNPCCNQNNDNKDLGTTKQVQVIGTVAPASVYEAIVNVGVTRSGTSHTDNYYVADEYDNSTSYYPLPIDKTYNVAIIPAEKPGDVETISFYGSYKG